MDQDRLNNRHLYRRGILAAVAAAGGWLAAAGRVRADAAAAERAKVVYHLSDLDKVAFVLGNIRHHFDGMGGPDKVTIALVVHGPALKAFHAKSASADTIGHVRDLSKAGLGLEACGHTMKAQNVTLADLLPDFVSADQGGVVRIAELQARGYAYLRP